MPLEITKVAQFDNHKGAIYTLGENDKHFFYSGGSDRVLAEWNLESLKLNNIIANTSSTIYSLYFCVDKNFLVVGQADGGVRILDLSEKKEIKFFQLGKLPIFDIKYSNVLDKLIVATGNGSLYVLSLKNLEITQSFSVSENKLRSLAIDKDHTEIAVGCSDNSIRTLDSKTLKEKKALLHHKYSVTTVAYHPNGKYLLSGSRDAHLNIWSTEDQYELYNSIPAHYYTIYSIAFSPDKLYFATSSRDKTIKIWDSSTFKLLKTIDTENHNGHTHSVNKLLWVDYENYLISAGDDRKIMIWKVKAE